MPVIWQPEMSVGNTIIDDEHKYLICLINSVELALKLKDDGKMIKLILDQLVEYTHEHFKREEKIQIKMKYPQYHTHKQEHQEILENLEGLRNRILDTVADSPVAPGNPDNSSNSSGGLEEDGVYVENLDEGEIDFEATEQSAVADSTLPLPTAEIVKLLRHWILDHVLKTDMQMKRYLSRLPSNFV